MATQPKNFGLIVNKDPTEEIAARNEDDAARAMHIATRVARKSLAAIPETVEKPLVQGLFDPRGTGDRFEFAQIDADIRRDVPEAVTGYNIPVNVPYDGVPLATAPGSSPGQLRKIRALIIKGGDVTGIVETVIAKGGTEHLDSIALVSMGLGNRRFEGGWGKANLIDKVRAGNPDTMELKQEGVTKITFGDKDMMVHDLSGADLCVADSITLSRFDAAHQLQATVGYLKESPEYWATMMRTGPRPQ